ncbi:MAG: hypothetical protein NCW75_08700 [Phycisphaera sp.]|nr:MAG: hypothetical protein NCW75_08700 [Phycisphaera sp.]
MTSRPPEYDQSDRTAHPWTVAEPGSWTELAESTAFVFRAGGLAFHPVTIALAGLAALAASWTLPISAEELLPWMGVQGFWGTVWAWAKLTWLVLIVCVCGTAIARTIAARPTRAEVWGRFPTMLASCGLCVSTYVSALVGIMLATWLAIAVGGWIGGSFGGGLATLLGFAAMLSVALATILLLLAIPAIATNDADAPDAIQRAAANLIARPGLTLALIAIVSASLGLLAFAATTLFGVAYAHALDGWDDAPDLVWLPSTLVLFVVLAFGWAAYTQVLLTLREVVDREDRASCWDPRPQAEAIHQAVEARATVSRGGTSPDPEPEI